MASFEPPSEGVLIRQMDSQQPRSLEGQHNFTGAFSSARYAVALHSALRQQHFASTDVLRGTHKGVHASRFC